MWSCILKYLGLIMNCTGNKNVNIIKIKLIVIHTYLIIAKLTITNMDSEL